MSIAFGIDIGGSGIKGALVDLATGELIGNRHRIPTPEKSTPKNVAQVCKTLLEHFEIPSDMPVGITFPAPVKRNIVRFMANLDKSWAGTNVRDLMEKETGYTVTAINDADAAGYAEFAYGAAQGHPGLVIVTTLGTGIGSGLIIAGTLVPNVELGHLEIDGHNAESRASAAAKKRDGLSWGKWAKLLQRYYETVEMLFSPDLFVVGGGVSRESDEFIPRLKLETPIVPAKLRNTAGIVGVAALAAEEAKKH